MIHRKAPARDGLSLLRRDRPAGNAWTLTAGGQARTVTVTRLARARRLTLRIDATTGTVAVSAPPHVADRDIHAFLDRQHAWLADRLARLPDRVPFQDGAVVPVLGLDRRITHRPQARSLARIDGETIVVGGDPDLIAPRVTRLLKATARDEITALAHPLAARIGRPIAGIAIRDTRSRWGSCTAKGQLNFSWRLVLAPDWVLAYLVAHEVAHLREMNHGPRFWALCRELYPDLTAAKAWLKAHGTGLHRYG